MSGDNFATASYLLSLHCTFFGGVVLFCFAAELVIICAIRTKDPCYFIFYCTLLYCMLLYCVTFYSCLLLFYLFFLILMCNPVTWILASLTGNQNLFNTNLKKVYILHILVYSLTKWVCYFRDLEAYRLYRGIEGKTKIKSYQAIVY